MKTNDIRNNFNRAGGAHLPEPGGLQVAGSLYEHSHYFDDIRPLCKHLRQMLFFHDWSMYVYYIRFRTLDLVLVKIRK
jgi:hypothetical protein